MKIKRKYIGLCAVIVCCIIGITGCIEEPTPKAYLTEYELSATLLADVLGLPEVSVSDTMTELNVESFFTVESPSDVALDYQEEYDTWATHYDDVLMAEPELTLYVGAWRRVTTMHAVVIASGTYVSDATGHDTIVCTSHGTIALYAELLAAIES